MATAEPSPDWTAQDAIEHLKSLASARNIEGMGRYGIETSNALGVSNAVLRPLARKLKRNHPRALDLFVGLLRWNKLIRKVDLSSVLVENAKASPINVFQYG